MTSSEGWTLDKFLEELRATAAVYKFGFRTGYRRWRDSRDCYPLTTYAILACFPGVTRALDPVEAVYVRMALVDKTVLSRRIVTPYDVMQHLPLSYDLIMAVVSAACASMRYDAGLRRELFLATGVKPSQWAKAVFCLPPPVLQSQEDEVCPHPSQLKLPFQ